MAHFFLQRVGKTRSRPENEGRFGDMAFVREAVKKKEITGCVGEEGFFVLNYKGMYALKGFGIFSG